MANIRIGPDGSIIKDDVVVETDERTIIREDGTIETINAGGFVAPPVREPVFNAPPVSPLERNGNRNSSVNTQQPTNSMPSGSGSRQRGRADLKGIKEKEYDIQIMDGRIKNAVPKNIVIATIVLCILGIIGSYAFFIPAIATGIMVLVGLAKKSQLEAERVRMCEELKAMERGK